MTATLWIITPVYLDVASFLILRDRLHDVVAATPEWRDCDLRFVVAEDTAGRDPEVRALDELEDVTVIQPPFNLGHQRAIVYALRKLGGRIGDDDYVVTMDSDGEDTPEDVPRLLAPLHEQTLQPVVVALRTSRQETFAFKLFYLLFRALFVVLTGVTVRSGNFAAYRGQTACSILGHPSFDVTYSAALISLDLPIVGIPCARGARYAGQSRMGMAKLVRHGLGMLMPYLDRIAIRALMLFSAIVTACVALSIAVVVIRLSTRHAIPGWATATLLGLWISSLISIGNFVVLFAVYTQNRAMALSRLEQEEYGRA
jgi:glycosyltransferase involved in cell wall biosynthesis